MEGRMTEYVKHPGALISLYWNLHKAQNTDWILGKFNRKIKVCALLAQEAHTSLKSHHELNIWQMISLL
jgi:hypothetical protein